MSELQSKHGTKVKTRSPTAPMDSFSVGLALATTFLWGGTAVSNQFAMDALPPVLLGGVRFGLAAIFMVAWCRLDGSPLLLKKGQWQPGWIMGILLFLQILTFNLGIIRTTSSHASILVNSYIFWVAACEVLVFKTVRFGWKQWVGLILAGIGCSWVFLNTGPGAGGGYDTPTIPGDLILAGSGLILAVKILYTKHVVRSVAPGTIILWHDLLGALIFFVCSLCLQEDFRGPMTWTAALATLYGGLIISGFCFGANALLLRRHGASQVSVFSFSTPVFGVAFGVCLRGDRLSFGLLFGGVLVALGIFLVNRMNPSSVRKIDGNCGEPDAAEKGQETA